jgi:general L-amino acid transport system substrate-binding protein
MKRGILTFATATLGAALLVGIGAKSSPAQTLKAVKDRGSVICGVSQGIAGFSNPDDKGNWTGLDVDFCRAIAAAVFNDPNKVKFSPLSAKDRFTALQSSEIDVLARNSTWTSSRDTSLGLNFAAVNYYDGQGFMVRKALKVNSALELNGASVCTQTGTTTELNLADYFRANNMKYEVIAFATADETVKAYESGRCDAFTTDVSQLYAEKLKLANANDHVILPEIVSKEPLAPVVRHGVVRHRQMGALRHDQCRGTWRVAEDHRRRPEIPAARDQAAGGHGRRLWRAARSDQGLGGAHHQARRQLRRKF